MKICIACGMPMKEDADYPMGDRSKVYCVYCARKDGEMQSYEEKLESLTSFITRTQGLDKSVAQTVASDMMSRLPAWKEEK